MFIRDSITNHCALTFVRSMILPYIDYGCLFLSTCLQGGINKLQVLQNKMIRCALKANGYVNIKALHRQSNILMVKDRIIFNQLKFIYVNLQSDMSLFTYCQHPGLATCSVLNSKLSLTTPNYSIYRKSILYEGAHAWNCLEMDIKQSPSLASFKRKLKNKLLTSYEV